LLRGDRIISLPETIKFFDISALLGLGCIMYSTIQIQQLSAMDLNLDSLLNIADTTVDRMTKEEHQITLKLRFLHEKAICPHCNQVSEELHQNRPILIRDLGSSGTASATTPTILAQRSREFDDPPNTPPANTPPPFPFDAGPNFIRPEFGNFNLPSQNNVTPPQNSVSSSQNSVTASFTVVQPDRIYRIGGFSEDRLKQYTSDILIENGASYLQSITADVKTGNSAVDGVYQTQFNRGQNFSFRITKNNRDSLTSERLDSNRWRIRFMRNNIEVFNSVLERKEQLKRNNKIPIDIHLEELDNNNETVLIAEDSCSDVDRFIGSFLNSIDDFAEKIISTFNGGVDVAEQLPEGAGEGLEKGSELVQEGMNTINSGRELDRLKECAKNEDNVAEQPSQPNQNPPLSPPSPDLQASRGNNSRPSGPLKHGKSYGDPHIATFDGYRYSFQTIGEFILVQSKDGAFQVQTRQGQVPGRQASLNTAAAMKVGNNRIAIYAKDFPDGNANNPVWVNGRPATVERTLELPGGGTIQGGGGSYIIQWPTGEQVGISRISVAGMNFMNVAPGVPEQADRYMGLLGNMNNNKDDDLQTRDGRVIPSKDNSTYSTLRSALGNFGSIPLPLTQLENVFFEQLYKEFGNSWRISQTESLFNYPPNQSTDNFTNRNFPSTFGSIASLLPAQLRQAQDVCRQAGVTGDLLEGCIFDVSATGENGFVQAALDTVLDQVRNRVESELRNRIPIPVPFQLPF